MIADFGEIVAYVGQGSTLTKQQEGLLNLLWPLVEQSIKDLLRCGVEQTTYTHILPARNANNNFDPLLDRYDVVGTQAVAVAWSYACGDRLQLLECPVRSITSVYQDYQAFGGDYPGAFGTSTLLTQGTHYFLDQETPGFSRTGQLVRISGVWPPLQRTVKATYSAGWSRAELDGDPAQAFNASPIKGAVLDAMALSFNVSSALQGGQSGAITLEMLGDYQVMFDAKDNGFQVVIPKSTRFKLARFINYARFLG